MPDKPPEKIHQANRRWVVPPSRGRFGAMVALTIFFAFASELMAQMRQLDVAGALVSNQASVTSSVIDIGPIDSIFDDNIFTMARSENVNPLVVTLHFSSLLELAGSRILFFDADSEWRIETADSVEDLDSMTGSFRVALDWAYAGNSIWAERTLTNPIACRTVRLKLQHPAGDNYVQLSEWRLDALDALDADGKVRITHGRKLGDNIELTWNTLAILASQWFEIQSSTNLADWNGAGFYKSAGDSLTQQVAAPVDNGAFFRVRTAQAEERPRITKRVLVMNFDPILESHGNRRLNEFMGWNDPHVLTTNYLNDLTTASGGYVQWEAAAWVDLDLWPQQSDGFSYNDTSYSQSWNNSAQYPWHTNSSGTLSTVDYDVLLDMPLAGMGGKSAHQMATNGEVDEIICWAHPYAGFYESRMIGRTAYWCNSGPLLRPSRLYVVMGLNPERGVAEAIHSFGHRCEFILRHVFGNWSNDSTINHLWDRFTRNGPLHGVDVAGCGNVHYPPNTSMGYAYDVLTPVSSEADRWLNYPDLVGSVEDVSASTWGGPDYQRNYLRWWMAHFPKMLGRYVDGSNPINNGKLNNWWGYLVDMNEYTESR